MANRALGGSRRRGRLAIGEDPWRALDARVLDFSSLYNAKGVARMTDIKLRLPLPTTLILFVAATGGASQLRCWQLAEQKGCRQSVQR
jgi:hypothetical protein